jgi:alpha-glucosidase
MFLHNIIIYHAYLPSFVKNLLQIETKIPYLKLLNVDYLWINPIYESGGKDCGYDIKDYLTIDNKFGSLDDFKQLIMILKNNKIKLLMDLVINHTSDQHEWFTKSQNCIDPYTNYYIWRDKKDLNNDFNSEFEESAWTYCNIRKQYYYHYFYKEQPDLNLKNILVVNEIKNIIKFWISLGIAGFRMDAISCLIPNEQTGQQLNTNETFDLLEHLRGWASSELKNKILFLGETEFSDINYAKRFYKSIDLVMNYRLAYLNELNNIKYVNELTKWYGISIASSKNPLFYFYNHDRKRQRYGENNIYIAKLMATLLLIQHGAKIIYYGQEINMKEGQNHNIDKIGRDGCRTPMQWSAEYANIPHWIPINNDYKENNVLIQNEDDDSILNWYRYLSKFQKDITEINDISTYNDLLILKIKKKLESYKILLNFNNNTVQYIDNINIIKRSYINCEKLNIINPYEVIICRQ